MKVLETELLAAFDVDHTLIIPNVNGTHELLFAGEPLRFDPVWSHIKLLKSWKERGYFVIIWSHNGYKHALNVVECLQLQEFVDLIQTKPIKHVDDMKDVESIVGQRVWIG